MHPLRVIRLPIRSKPDPFNATEFPAQLKDIRCVAFEMRFGPEAKDRFYECMMAGCRGCGGIPFALTVSEIPEEVLEHLRTHVELCEGVLRGREQQKVPVGHLP